MAEVGGAMRMKDWLQDIDIRRLLGKMKLRAIIRGHLACLINTSVWGLQRSLGRGQSREIKYLLTILSFYYYIPIATAIFVPKRELCELVD